MAHIAVVGGGILGLAVAHELATRGKRITLLEKENDYARHQTGHNSGVVHAGLYYAPGSFKARMCVAGNASMTAFAKEHGVAMQVCGKLVLATEQDELPRLHTLRERAAANGVPARLLSQAEAREFEPEARCVAGLRVESTGIIDYRGVCAALVRLLGEYGADLRTGAEVRAVHPRPDGVVLVTRGGEVRADAVVNCAGLHSDRIARLAGLRPSARIVPFRGEYHELRPEARKLVRGLIYPVPDPRFPFLGVHLTRMLDGGVHAGPNAVLALRREGYRWRDISARDLAGTLGFPGFWRLARKHTRTGAQELLRSFSTARFAASLARLVPAVTAADLVRAEAGVRAQALRPDGALVDDFLIERAPRQVHVLNAPSPAATSALEIGRHVADEVAAVLP
ncbi:MULTISPECIES: L-2-hydroxyglutarate oxidase [unclassified Crossiella]|uniref:L-2-hydroxyglutarate oxidase n=1 Tax=unclassified Crossiella TaxID=2620835 RepID=UPI0020000276|nr:MULTISPECIES: L-2-hydroxyglutarate oxidase [unclassified Crossiella]MCK2237523.1 L-2-hydroxyglutarate oxidase [Crossiella sp. S99.2]MCK2254809.1 L-2-hydroxyglutarate oxidase [Crossiella sp. S99.1]